VTALIDFLRGHHIEWAPMLRRYFLAAVGVAKLASAQGSPPVARKGRIKQSAMVVNFTNSGMTFDAMAETAARLGCKGMDLIPPKDWPTLEKYGLISTTCPRDIMTIEDGMLRKEQHDRLEKNMHGLIEQCAAHKCPNMIAVGGQRRGMSYEEGTDICVAFLNRLKAHAEDRGVTICLEIMNSKYTNPDLGRVDQICDHVAWGVGVCKRVNSPRVKILFDIYHVQIADGDVSQNIRDNIQWIGHFHTGGVPGRHELDETQELNYRFIATTIEETGYSGYVAHEYRPTPGRDVERSLNQAMEIMDV
jgi:hydroxypyruvate isomerase